eukprot:TRINITY_DN5601_c0_g1_i1.p1 TRINITY_DN5601_c0_g1~~TRINITY_DN5601_c0_g1_i1.p1  ORF type:complete len:403 (+),score=100.47 TRINITY_DN5601_c0_g1_i1:206-1414(+)
MATILASPATSFKVLGSVSHGPNCPCCGVALKAAQSIPAFAGLRPTSASKLVSSVSLNSRKVVAGAARSEAANAAVLEKPAAAPKKDTPVIVDYRIKRAAPAAAPKKDTPVIVDYRIKRAAPAAVATIATNFANAMEHESFIKACATELAVLGFNQDNCIAIVNTCRDEVCRPLVSLIDNEFGHSFNISGLGGLVNCGKTGMKAAFSHSPEHPCDTDGTLRERYIFFAFPHISIGESGMEGSLLRRGRGKPSSACGALIAVKNAAVTEGPAPDSDEYPSDDFEYHSLKRKVLAKPVCRNCGPEGPSLISVTKAAMEVITEDLEDLIAKTVDPATADYAVITGVQIHSGCNVPGEPFRMDRLVDYIAPSAMYAVIRGERYLMHCEVNQITNIKSIKESDLVNA